MPKEGLLGHILALTKETNYEQLLIENIANPLGMNDIRIELTQEMKVNLAIGHNDFKAVENWDLPTLAGAGAIRSSTSDLAQFIAANLGYVESPLMEAMQLTYQVTYEKEGKTSVALGWHITTGEVGDIIWHNGGTGGYRSFAGFVKETGVGVVVFTNSWVSVDDIGFHLLDASFELRNIK